MEQWLESNINDEKTYALVIYKNVSQVTRFPSCIRPSSFFYETLVLLWHVICHQHMKTYTSAASVNTSTADIIVCFCFTKSELL